VREKILKIPAPHLNCLPHRRRVSLHITSAAAEILDPGAHRGKKDKHISPSRPERARSRILSTILIEAEYYTNRRSVRRREKYNRHQRFSAPMAPKAYGSGAWSNPIKSAAASWPSRRIVPNHANGRQPAGPPSTVPASVDGNKPHRGPSSTISKGLLVFKSERRRGIGPT